MNQSFIVMMYFPFEKMTANYRLFGQSERDFKELQKKYRSLGTDLERFCKFTLKLETDSSFPAANKNYTLLQQSGLVSVFKARMACTSIRGNKLRIVYARHEASIEIIVIELYTKNQKAREDQQRIEEYLRYFQTP